MNYADLQIENDQPNMAALLLAAAVHILLVGALFFSVQWRSQAPTAISVEVWRSAPAPQPAPVIKAEPAPEPPPPPPPPPKVEPKPLPPKLETPVKPDIAVKDDKKKKEELKKPKEEPKPEPEPKPKPVEVKKDKPPEPKKEDVKKPAPEIRPDWNDELQRDLKQAQQQKALHDQRNRADAELRQIGQAQAELAASARQRGLANYIARIAGSIKTHIVLPPGIKGNPEAVFMVTQLPTGDVLEGGVKVQKSSGNKALDEAIVRAILKASPLPKPDDPSLFDRELRIPYRPYEQ